MRYTFLVCAAFLLLLASCQHSSNDPETTALNSALQNSNTYLTGRNSQLYIAMEKAMFMDEKSNRDWYERSVKLKKMTAETGKFLEDVKTNLLNGQGPVESQVIQEKLVQLYSLMESLAPGDKKKEMSFQPPLRYLAPLSVPALSLIENDIIIHESELVTAFVKEVSGNGGTIKFENLEVVVVPSSTCVRAGQQYQASIFLAAYSSVSDPQIILDPGDAGTVSVIAGKGTYTITASGLGRRELSGVVKMPSPNGQYRSYPFKTAYEVVK
jgi:hypothetical protein